MVNKHDSKVVTEERPTPFFARDQICFQEGKRKKMSSHSVPFSGIFEPSHYRGNKAFPLVRQEERGLRIMRHFIYYLASLKMMTAPLPLAPSSL